jgi:hypothetical protein
MQFRMLKIIIFYQSTLSILTGVTFYVDIVSFLSTFSIIEEILYKFLELYYKTVTILC